jgi:hypothetical protein
MTYMSDHLVKLSKCPFKFEMSRKSGKGVMYSNVHNNFVKIKLLLLFHETLCYLIDSLNLNQSCHLSWKCRRHVTSPRTIK